STDQGRAALERAIVQAVAYADVFDYPLTADEIHRYLIGVPASRGMVRGVLGNGRPAVLVRSGRYFMLEGRESAVDTRRARAAVGVSCPHRRTGAHGGASRHGVVPQLLPVGAGARAERAQPVHGPRGRSDGAFDWHANLPASTRVESLDRCLSAERGWRAAAC